MKPAEWEVRWHLLFLNLPHKVTSTVSLHTAPVSAIRLPFMVLGGLCHEIFNFLSFFPPPCCHQEIPFTLPCTFKPSKQ